MVSYILRRLLLIPITLFGITVMVFAIARFAPGGPGQLQARGEALDAEAAEAQREWYEERYGLNLPIHLQYLRWWRGLFSIEIEAIGWYDERTSAEAPLKPVFTYRAERPEYYARTADGKWFVATNVRYPAEPLRADDAEFLQIVDEADLELHPPIDPDYETPVHLFVEADLFPIESLAEDVEAERLVRAENADRVRADIPALAWSQDGEPLYENPADPDRPLLIVNGEWFVIEPSIQPSISAISDDATLRPLLGSAYNQQAQQKDGYAMPRHAVFFGTRSKLPEAEIPDDPQRLTVPTNVRLPAGLWVIPPNGDGSERTMLWQQAEPEPALFVRDGDNNWKRLIGDTRAQEPSAKVVRERNDAFRSRVSEDQINALRETQVDDREQRHAIMRGTLVDTPTPPTDRDIRRYKKETRIFEVTLGRSATSHLTVAEELSERLPRTLLINVLAFPLIYALAIPIGMLMAVRRGKTFDAVSNVVLLGFWSIPTVLSATLFIGYLGIGGVGIELFPTNKLNSAGHENMPFLTFMADLGWHLVLPVVCITYGGLAYLAKQMRAAMLDNFTMDYVRTARAKGVRSRDILFRHVLRNSMLPLITIFATILPAMIAGSIIIEKIFSIEGMGLLAFRAVQSRDYDVVQSLALIAGALNLTGLLLADICYALADPRITYS